MRPVRKTLTAPLSFIALAVFFGALCFSYYPLIQLGSSHGIHLDLSLLYILAVLAIGSSAVTLWQSRRLLQRLLPVQILAGFFIWMTLSVIWSSNTPRAIITTTFSWLLFAMICTVFAQRQNIKSHKKILILLISLGVGISCVWAFWQIFGDAAGVSSGLTLLPENYRSSVFGVARPTGFALEPQFFGSLLLVPFCALLYGYIQKKGVRGIEYYLILTATTLVLTLSRGALLAAAVGALILFALTRAQLARKVSAVGFLFVAIICAGVVQYSAASLNQRDTTSGYDSIRASLNQLSLGLVTLPVEQTTRPTKPTAAVAKPTSEPRYISSSTDSRLSMSQEALKTWTRSPSTVLFGSGIGSFGSTLHERNQRYNDGTVANNYYLELLSETGLVGILLFIAFMYSVLRGIVRKKQWFFLAALAAYLIQWCFFSGNANVIHVWVLIGLTIADSYAVKDRQI